MDNLLVLDLDETLWSGNFAETTFTPEFILRPHLGEFLEEVSAHWDLGIWTAATPNWADVGLEHIRKALGFDLRARAVFRWYRDRMKEETLIDYMPYSMEPRRVSLFKDAASFKLQEFAQYGNRILAIDDHKGNYKDEPNHRLIIPEWNGDPSDDQLKVLANYLATIHGEDFFPMDKRYWNH